MVNQAHYEVRILDKGETWTFHARYPQGDRKAAISAADHIDAQTKRGTRVVFYKFVPGENRYDQETVYTSRRAQAKGYHVEIPVSKSSYLSDAVAQSGRPSSRQRSRVSPLAEYVLVLGVAFFLAILSTAVASGALRQFRSQPDSGTTTILELVYLISFFFALSRIFRFRGQIAKKVMEWWDAPPPVRPIPDRQPPARPKTPARSALGRITAVSVEKPPVLSEPPAAPPNETQSDNQQVHATDGVQPELDQISGKEAEAKTELEAQSEIPGDDSIAPAISLDKAGIKRFVDEILSPTIARQTSDDPQARRGLMLLVAGAAVGLADLADVSDEERDALFREIMEMSRAGTPSDIPLSLHESIGANDPVAQALIKEGRLAVEGYIKSTKDIAGRLEQVLEAWRLGAMPPEPPPTVSYCLSARPSFEEVSPPQWPKYNNLVRACVSDHGGTELFPAGDGVLAEFSVLTSAIAAAESAHSRCTEADGSTISVVIFEVPCARNKERELGLSAAMQRLAEADPGETVYDVKVEGTMAKHREFTQPGIPDAQRPLAGNPG